mmetsp:Transcript_81282/g.238770  ORF Transcript_81282/g.238770 Transcript_81282/m.238770 type:complete len:124 (-) Transcript_81282:261-632(-)
MHTIPGAVSFGAAVSGVTRKSLDSIARRICSAVAVFHELLLRRRRLPARSRADSRHQSFRVVAPAGCRLQQWSMRTQRPSFHCQKSGPLARRWLTTSGISSVSVTEQLPPGYRPRGLAIGMQQ